MGREVHLYLVSSLSLSTSGWLGVKLMIRIDYVLAVYKCSHKSSIKLGESLQEGVDEILSQQDWQSKSTFPSFQIPPSLPLDLLP